MLRSGKKSDILECLRIPNTYPDNDISMKILDGAAIVHMVRPTKAANFSQYMERHFVPFIQSMVSESTVTRLDLIWDTYPDDSLKRQAQEKRGASTAGRTKVQGSTPIPGDWSKFLKNRDNKADLFRFIGQEMVAASPSFPNIIMYSTRDDMVIVHPSYSVDLTHIMPCNQQEADSRIFLHLSDAAQQGHQNVYNKDRR